MCLANSDSLVIGAPARMYVMVYQANAVCYILNLFVGNVGMNNEMVEDDIAEI